MKNIIFLLLLVLILFFVPKQLAAQTTKNYTITGICVDRNNKPLESVLVNAECTENTVSKPFSVKTSVDGRFTISYAITSVEEVEKLSTSATVSFASPNPTGGTVAFDLNTKMRDNIEWIVYNVLGEQVDKGTIFNTGNYQRINISFKDYANGIYIVQIRMKDQVFVRKINFIRGYLAPQGIGHSFPIQSKQEISDRYNITEFILKQLTFSKDHYRTKTLLKNQQITGDVPLDIGTVMIDTLAYTVKGKVVNVLKFDVPESMYVPYAELTFFKDGTKYITTSDITGSYDITLPAEQTDSINYSITAFHNFPIIEQYPYAFKPIEFITLRSDTVKNISVALADSGHTFVNNEYNGYSILNVYNMTSPRGKNFRWESFPKIYINTARQELADYIKKLLFEDDLPLFKSIENPNGITPDIIVGVDPPAAGTAGYLLIDEVTFASESGYKLTTDIAQGFITSANISVYGWLIPNDLSAFKKRFNKEFYICMTNIGTIDKIISNQIPSILNIYYNSWINPSHPSERGSPTLFDKMSMRLINYLPPLSNFRNDLNVY